MGVDEAWRYQLAWGFDDPLGAPLGGHDVRWTDCGDLVANDGERRAIEGSTWRLKVQDCAAGDQQVAPPRAHGWRKHCHSLQQFEWEFLASKALIGDYPRTLCPPVGKQVAERHLHQTGDERQGVKIRVG